MKRTLPFFSYAFHPIFIPVYAVLFYFMFGANFFTTEQMLLVALQVAIILVFIPTCIFYLLRLFGKVDTIMIGEISQRRIPLLIQALLLYTLLRNSLDIDYVFELYFFFLGALASTLAALLLSLIKIKASLHMMGISALTIFVIGLSLHNRIDALYTVAFLVLLNGVIASSRLMMKAHTVEELIIGFCCGAAPQLALWYFWL